MSVHFSSLKEKMKMYNCFGLSMAAKFLHDGVIIDEFNEAEQKICIRIPKESFVYHNRDSQVITDAGSYAKRMKVVLSELMHLPDLKLYYKTYDKNWTKEDGDKNMHTYIKEYI